MVTDTRVSGEKNNERKIRNEKWNEVRKAPTVADI